MIFIYAGIGFLVPAVLLALHHWYIHKDDPPEDGKGNPCLLQPSDCCVFSRGTHETPILIFSLIAGVLIFIGLLSLG